MTVLGVHQQDLNVAPTGLMFQLTTVVLILAAVDLWWLDTFDAVFRFLSQ